MTFYDVTTFFKTIYNSTLLSFTNLQFTIDSMTIKKINLVKDTFLSMVRTQFLSHIHMYIAYVRLSLSHNLSVNKGPSFAKPCMQWLWTLNLYINNNPTSDHAAMSAIMTYKKPFFLAYLYMTVLVFLGLYLQIGQDQHLFYLICMLSQCWPTVSWYVHWFIVIFYTTSMLIDRSCSI